MRRSNRTTKNIPMVGDESNWITIECRDGTVMALRKEGPPKAPAQPTPDTQLGLFGEAR
jgi:hypothetical protein